ncbi:hypothetical protein [Ruminococcus sp.]|uniref:hypothetical protein n=1 Tax=Ruminococcus sp. TaxID=41978 RepID=UPI0025E4D7CE|nr:hypothetical protein [Ruminococcus sp.]MBQ8967227.1 hypothetical protein [Ruminococcus sp.]
MTVRMAQCIVDLIVIQGRLWEMRYNENHDEKGRFTFGKSGSAVSGKTVDKSGKSDIIEVDPTGCNDFKVKGFANKQKLNNHWQNGRTHKEEFVKDGIITKEQYEREGIKLVESAVGGDIIGHTDAHNNVIRYDTKRNYFAKGDPNKGLRTFMKPKEGRQYYETQREEDLKHGGKA